MSKKYTSNSFIAGNSVPIDDCVRIISLYNSGWGISDIYNEINYDRATIRGVLVKHGFEIEKCRKWIIYRDYFNEFKDEIILTFNQLKTIKGCSEKFKDIPPERIKQFLIKEGFYKLEKSLSLTEELECINFYLKEFLTAEEIGKKYGHCAGNIIKILKKHGVKIRKHQDYKFDRLFSKEKENEILNKYLDNVSIKKLAKIYKSTIASISRLIKARGYPILMSQNQKEAYRNEKEIIRDYLSELPIKYISKKYKTNDRNVKKILLKNKITIHKGSFFNKKKISYSNEVSYKKQNIIELSVLEDLIKKYQTEYISIEKLAKQAGCCVEVLKREFEKRGVKITDRKIIRATPTEEEAKLILESYPKLTIKEIAKKISKTNQAVRKFLVLSGVEIRTNLNPKSPRFGYIGYYKEYLFRSLMELSFILDKETGHVIRSAEKKHMIKYRFDNKIRKYYPDFILDDKKIFEIKPKSYFSDRKVRRKCKAIKRYCKNIGLQFEMTDWKIDLGRIRNLFLSGAIKIVNKSRESVETYLKIKNSHYLYEI